MKYRRSILNTLATIVLAATITPAALHAASVTLVNPSFEDNILSDGNRTTTVNGWNIITGNTTVPVVGTALTDHVTTYNPTAASYAGAAGNGSAPGMTGANVLDMHSDLVGLTGSVQQTTSVPLTANTTYTFTIAVGNPADDLFHGYNVSLTAGVTVLNFAAGNNIGDGTFQDITVTYTPNLLDPVVASLITQAQPLTITLSSSVVALGATSVSFDNARLDATVTPVPEPSTIATIAAGFALLGYVAYKRRNTAALA